MTPISFLNGRRPQFYFKWKTTSILFLNERQPTDLRLKLQHPKLNSQPISQDEIILHLVKFLPPVTFGSGRVIFINLGIFFSFLIIFGYILDRVVRNVNPTHYQIYHWNIAHRTICTVKYPTHIKCMSVICQAQPKPQPASNPTL